MRADYLTFYTRPAAIVRGAMVTMAAASVLLPTVASAYVGPGAGLAMIGSLAAVVFAVLAAVVGLVLLPLRILIKALKAREGRKVQITPQQALSSPMSE